jgi:hypothetical protein
MKVATKAKLSLFRSKQLGRVSYDGCTFTYTQLGNVKVITARKGNSACWEVATNLSEDTARVWRDIKAEAKANV